MAAILYLLVSAAVVIAVARLTRVSGMAAAALILAPLLATGGVLFHGRVFGPVALAYVNGPLAPMAEQVGVQSVGNPTASDVYAQFLPWHEAVRDSIAHHQWPLWDRFASCGTVLAGAVQSAPYHPVQIIALLLPLRDAVTFTATMLFFIAALSMFLFMRPFVKTESAALFAGVGWMFCDYIIQYAGTAHAMSVAVVPMLLLAARNGATSPSIRSSTLLALVLVLLVFSGHPETLLHAVALAAAYFGLELWLVRGRQWRRAVLAGLSGGVAALLLSAISILPLIEAIPQTDEVRYRTSPFDTASAGSKRITHHLIAELFPFIEGTAGLEVARHAEPIQHPWGGSAYAGTLLFAIGAFGLHRRRDGEQWFFAAVALFGLLIGASTPGLITLFRSLPLFSIAVNERMIWFAALAFVVLAGRGVDEWLTDERERDPMLAVACLLTAAVIGAAVALALPRLIGAGLSSPYVRTELMRAVLPLLLGAGVVLAVRPRRAAIALITLLLIVSRAADTELARSSVPRRAFYPPFAGLSLLVGADPFRVVGQGPLLTPNTAAHYHLEDVRGYHAMTFARFADTYPLWSIKQPVWSNRVEHLDAPMLSMMNVLYALAIPTAENPPGWVRRGSFIGYDILENTRALPRAFVPANVHIVRRSSDALEPMRHCRDFGAEGWIESDEEPHDDVNGPGSVTLRSSGSHFDLHALMVRDGWIIVSEAAWKGWSAIENGRELPIHFADHAFVGVHVGGGEHHVKLVYRPRSFVVGSAISGASALALGILLFSTRKRRPSASESRATAAADD
jgi:Bacterial membrane protein YfhO